MKIVFTWIPLAVLTTCLCGIVYLAVQQDYRQSANDPQIQMAEDTAIKLTRGTFSFPQQNVDIDQNLSPFMMIFNSNGQVTSSQAYLDGATPTIPQGVFETTKAKGETRFTWQPKTGVRIATVVVATPVGYVLAGRNLREVEKRETMLFQEVVLGWITTLIILLIAVAGKVMLVKSSKKK